LLPSLDPNTSYSSENPRRESTLQLQVLQQLERQTIDSSASARAAWMRRVIAIDAEVARIAEHDSHFQALLKGSLTDESSAIPALAERFIELLNRAFDIRSRADLADD
jgi:hypothetical protein